MTKDPVKVNPSKKCNGAFWVAATVIDYFISSAVPSLEILVYLVMARYTDKSGMFSKAGYKVITERLSIGKNKAIRAVKELLRYSDGDGNDADKILYTPGSWYMLEYKGGMIIDGEYDNERWVLNDFGCGRRVNIVWFDNSIIGCKGMHSKPLLKIIRQDILIITLLTVHRYYSIDFHGVDPYYFYEKYTVCNEIDIGRQIICQHKRSGLYINKSELNHLRYINNINNLDKADDSTISVRMEKALGSLIQCGFINKTIVAVKPWPNQHPQYPEATQVLYELDVKSKYEKRDEYMFAEDMDEFAAQHGMKSSRGGIKFYNKYSTVSQNQSVQLMGIYTPSFIPKSLTNFANNILETREARKEYAKRAFLGQGDELEERSDLGFAPDISL